VDEHQVGVAQAQVTQTVLGRFAAILGFLDFGHEEDVVARNSAFPDRFADRRLSAGVPRGVDQPVSEVQRGPNRVRAAAQLPGSKPHRGYLRAGRQAERIHTSSQARGYPARMGA
jgi:hypothetical protein